jgi:hypothetical protein
MKKVTLKLQGYRITGTADLTPWGGGNASIEMKPFTVKSIKQIPDLINDNGFGVEAINGAICHISRLYDHGYTVYARTIVIGEVSPNTYEADYQT